MGGMNCAYKYKDLKSSELKGLCEFDPRPRHQIKILRLGERTVPDMVTENRDRNQIIRKLRETVPELTLEQIGKAFDGLSRQRVYQILKQSQDCATILDKMENIENKEPIFKEPVSATEAAKILNIPYGVVSMWVSRGFVKVVNHPGHAAPGKFVLLDPVSLQERIDRYKPRRKKEKATA